VGALVTVVVPNPPAVLTGSLTRVAGRNQDAAFVALVASEIDLNLTKVRVAWVAVGGDRNGGSGPATRWCHARVHFLNVCRGATKSAASNGSAADLRHLLPTGNKVPSRVGRTTPGLVGFGFCGFDVLLTSVGLHKRFK
jgi:hypothetical protein